MLRSTWVLAFLAAMALPVPPAQAQATPPGPPVGLQAVPVEGGVRLTWEDPAYNGTEPVEAYRIYRDGMVLAEELDGLTREFLDTGGNELSTYLVSAVNGIGEGPPTAASATSTCLTWYLGRVPPLAVNLTSCLGAQALLEP
jgi:hypothetical protein